MTETHAPPEPPQGQDDPPDIFTVLRAIIEYLRDSEEAVNDPEIERRRLPLLRAVVRLREEIEQP